MHYLFNGAAGFNQDISSWDVSSVTDMNYMFKHAVALSDENKCAIHTAFSVANEHWDTASDHRAVLGAWGEYCDAVPIGITALTDNNFPTAVSLWFSDASSATATYGHISKWDVSAVTNMQEAFKERASFNEDISSWDVSNVTNMSNMFNRAAAFNQDISSWDVSSVTDMNLMFDGA